LENDLSTCTEPCPNACPFDPEFFKGRPKVSLDACRHNVYTAAMTKDSALRIRVETELREKFLALCREQDRPAAQVLREFMRKYLAEHEAAKSKPHKNKTSQRRVLK